MRRALYSLTVYPFVFACLVSYIAYSKNTETVKLNQELRAALQEAQKKECGNIMIDHAMDRLFTRVYGYLEVSNRYLKAKPATPSSTQIGLDARHEALRLSEEIDAQMERCLEWRKRKREPSFAHQG